MVSISAHTLRRVQLGYVVLCLLAVLGFATTVFAQQPIEISEPKVPAGTVFLTQGTVDLSVKVNNAEVKKLRALTSQINEAKEVLDNTRQEFPVDSNQVFQSISVNVFKGFNTIKLIGLKEDLEPVANATVSLSVTCTGKKCGGGAPQTGSGGGGGGGGGSQTQSDNITIKTDAITEGAVNTYFVVKKDSKITKLDVTVYGPDKRIIDSKSPLTLIQVGDTLIANASFKVVAGKNRIQVFDVDKQTEKANWALAEVTCTPNPPTVTCSSPPSGPKPAQVGLLHIIGPEKKDGPTNVYDAKTIPVKVKLDAASPTTQLKVKVMNNDALVAQKPDTFDVPVAAGAAREKTIDLKIGKGLNKITVFDPANEAAQLDYVEINCEGDACGKEPVNKLSVAVSAPKDDQGTYQVKNVGSLDSLVTVPKGDTKRIRYDVYGPNDKSFNDTTPVPDATAKAVEVPLRLEFFKGLNTIRIYDADKGGGDGDVSLRVNCDGDGCAPILGVASFSTPFTRAIVGIEQAAAASANPEQKLFLEFNLTAPLFRDGKSPLKAPLWLWLNPRITSLPQQNSATVAEFATAANFISPFTAGKVNEIAQGFEFTGGFEVPLKINGSRVTAPIASGFGPTTKVRFGVSTIFGVGAAAPFSSQKSVQVFTVNQTVIDRFPGAVGKKYIAFVSGDRTRFFRQYSAGLRLKTYYVRGDAKDELDNIFPGILDFTVGQNESVTEGKLRGVVIRIDGIFPLPFIKGDKKGSVYVFGSALMKPNHARILAPIFLQLPDTTVQVPGPDVFIQQTPAEDRDHYRIGIGVDLIRLIKRN